MISCLNAIFLRKLVIIQHKLCAELRRKKSESPSFDKKSVMEHSYRFLFKSDLARADAVTASPIPFCLLRRHFPVRGNNPPLRDGTSPLDCADFTGAGYAPTVYFVILSEAKNLTQSRVRSIIRRDSPQLAVRSGRRIQPCSGRRDVDPYGGWYVTVGSCEIQPCSGG